MTTYFSINHTDKPIKVKVLSYMLIPDNGKNRSFHLHRIVENSYKHPDAQEDYYLPIIEIEYVGKFREGDKEFPALSLYDNAIKNLEVTVPTVLDIPQVLG